MTALPLLYVSRFDVSPDRTTPFRAWFSRRHAPDLLAAGFLSATLFEALSGSPRVCDLYELSDLSSFGPAYQAARAADDEEPSLPGTVTNQSRAVYRQVCTAGLPDTSGAGPHWTAALVAPVMATLRFSCVENDRAVALWFQERELSALLARPGCLTARLGAQVEAGRPNREPRPWSLFTEWAYQDAALEWVAYDEASEQHRDLGPLMRPSRHVLVRRQSAVNPQAWKA
jgi:hypothetical protein